MKHPIVVMTLVLAGAGLHPSLGAERVQNEPASSSRAPVGTPAAGVSSALSGTPPTVATIVPPAVPTREELRRDVVALEAKFVQAVNAATQSTSPDKKDRLNRLFNALGKLEKLIPRERFDPSAIVARVGKDPAALARWVKDHTALVAYRGTLRGGVGVLMDRRGNSLDRALLLHDLLRLAGRPARLARMQLSGVALEIVVASAYRPAAALTIVKASDAIADKIIKQSGIDAATFVTEQAALGEATRQLGERVRSRAKEQSAALLAAVKPYMAPSATDEGSWRRGALADHWFVQYRDGGVWVGLDPIPGRDTVEPLGDPASTMARTSLPGDLYHRVRVQVVVEFWRDGTLQSRPVLDHVFAPSQSLGQTISLRSIPANWPDASKLRAASEPSRAVLEAAVAQHEWTPVLVIGNRQVATHSITDDGRLIDATAGDSPGLGRNVGSRNKRAIGSAGGLFDSLPSGEVAKSKPAAPPVSGPSGVLTAEWIEFEIIAPGIPTEKARRHVFDLVGPEARAAQRLARPELTERQRLDRALALLGEVELLAVGSQLPPEYVIATRASRLLALRSFLLQAVGSRDTNARPPASAQPSPGPLLDIAVARHEWSASADRLYFDRPNVLAHWRGVRSNDGTNLRVREDLDVVSNYLAVTDADRATSFQVRLEQGVLDTNVESVLFNACPGCEAWGNAADLFATSGARKEAWLLLAPRSQMPNSVPLLAAARARVNHTSSSGALVALRSASDAGGAKGVAWWTIDPLTGRTLGIGPDGLGQESLEYSMVFKALVVNVFCQLAVSVEMAVGNSSPAQFYIGTAMCLAGVGFGVTAASYAFSGAALIASRLDWFSIAFTGIGMAIGATR